MLRSEALTTRLQRFFYDEEVPFGLAMCRICLPIFLMTILVPRWFVCREIYSADGATGQVSVGFLGTEMLPEFSGTVVAALYAIMLFSFVCISIGYCTRVSAAIAFVLFTYFCMLDAVSTMTKYTVITSHVLLLLSLSECGSIWSIDAWLATRKRNLDPTKPRFAYPKSAAWPRRLMQLFIGFVYFGAAMTKIHTPSFFSGDQMQYWMLTHLNYGHPVGEFFSLYPILLVTAAYVTAVWEILFIFCGWKGSLRSVILPVGIFFHFMTTLTLGLLIFPIICYCTYFSFLDDEDVSQISAWMRRQARRFEWIRTIGNRLVAWRTGLGEHPEWRRLAQLGFAFAIPLVAVLGVELEYSWDIYGERRPEGRHQLTAIEPERAALMLAPVAPQRAIDKFFSVDLGTFLISDLLADRRKSFRQGEKMIAQCNLVPPHEDMVVECKIRDSENRTMQRIIAVASREMLRVDIRYPIGEDMAPGEYSMSIETGGQHVMKKSFTVLPKYGTVAVR